MNAPPRGWIALVLGLAAVAAAAPLLSSATAQVARAPFGQGTHAFRRILYDQGMKPLHQVSELGADPRHTLLIVLGETGVLEKIPGGLKPFLSQGGAALIATDRQTPPSLWEDFRIKVTGQPVRIIDTSWATGYRGLVECPNLVGVPAASPALLPTPTLQAGEQPRPPLVATNRPSNLDLSLPTRGLSLLALLPAGCSIGTNGRYLPVPQPFAVGGPVGQGELLVLADHSLFINDMLLQTDNDNIAFTYNCLDWLTSTGTDQPRDRVLFVEEGDILTTFDIPLKPTLPQIPPLNALVPAADKATAEMERDDVFNKEFRNWLADVVPGHDPMRVARILLGVLLTGVLAMYGFYRLSRSRHRVEYGAPLLDAALGQHTPTQTLLEQRHQALLGTRNLWEPARALARQAFASLGPSGINSVNGGEPVVTVEASWWQRRRWARQVRRLWRLAYGERPRRIRPRQFTQLLGELEAMQAAVAAGTLRLQPAPVLAVPPRRPAVTGAAGTPARAEGTVA